MIWTTFLFILAWAVIFIAIGAFRKKASWMFLASFFCIFIGGTWIAEGVEIPTGDITIQEDGNTTYLVHDTNTLKPDNQPRDISSFLAPLMFWGGFALFLVAIGFLWKELRTKHPDEI